MTTGRATAGKRVLAGQVVVSTAAATQAAPMTPDTPEASAASSAGQIPGRAPAIARRLAAFVYEGVLLVGVLMTAGLLFSGLTQQRHARQGKAGLQAFLFVVLAIYFTTFWTRGGQTLAMKAWHLRLVSADGSAVPQWRALLRYGLAWLWLVPAWAIAHFAGLQGGASFGLTMGAGVLGYAALAGLRQDRQFWHDALCGTRVVDWRPAPSVKAKWWHL